MDQPFSLSNCDHDTLTLGAPETVDGSPRFIDGLRDECEDRVRDKSAGKTCSKRNASIRS